MSFIGVDIYRSLHFLKEHMKRNNRFPANGGKSGANSVFGAGDSREDKMPKIGKQKVRVDRENVLVECENIMRVLQKRTLLEIEYHGEEGTGLGPTLEFYTLVSRALRADEGLWRAATTDGSLFPRPLAPGKNAARTREVCRRF